MMSNEYQDKFKRCIDYIKARSDNEKNPKIKLLKGGAYSIKQYYLENNKLNDIRGASAILSYVEQELIPEIIKDRFCEDCIIYNGGGNVFCILPYSTDDSFAIELEKQAQKYLISANVAFVFMDAQLSDIYGDNYQETMRHLEELLSERKKLKISVAVTPENPFINGGMPWKKNKVIAVKAVEKNGGICTMCKSRGARYLSEGKSVCASCLNKIAVGKETKVNLYRDEYKLYTGLEAELTQSLSDIDKEYVAVLYGDGNNMGQIIANFSKIDQMMCFSENVNKIVKKAVFESMSDLRIKKFEIVGLGGDDVFIIVSGYKAIELAVNIINKYKTKMNMAGYNSTMSVGVCIAKTKTPIRIMLEKAEEKLEEAKEQSKRDTVLNCDTGTLSFAVLDDPTESADSGTNKFGARMTLQPYSPDAMTDVIKYIRSINEPTTLRNIYDAYMEADCDTEVELFVKYLKVRLKNKFRLPGKITGYDYVNAVYKRNGDDIRCVIWRDIIELYSFIKGADNEKNI